MTAIFEQKNVVNGFFFKYSCLNTFLYYYTPASYQEEMSMQESMPFPSEVVSLQPDEEKTREEEDPSTEGSTEQPTVEPVTEHNPLETQVIVLKVPRISKSQSADFCNSLIQYLVKNKEY